MHFADGTCKCVTVRPRMTFQDGIFQIDQIQDPSVSLRKETRDILQPGIVKHSIDKHERDI
jgi:hypothetical protein